MRYPARFLVVAALFSTVPPALAQTSGDLSGHWEGALQVPAKELSVQVDLIRDKTGGFTGVVNIPDQKVSDFPLTNVSVTGQSVVFQLIHSAPGDNTFTGTMSEDGRTMSGTFAHEVYSMPFVLRRTGEARIQPPPPSTAIARGLEGTWRATVEVEGKALHLVLKMSNQPDGTARGSIVSVDQSETEIPIATITQAASSLVLDVRAVGAKYVGTISSDVTELSGTWTQGTVSLPLTFRR
jgi:hypothetical protein